MKKVAICAVSQHKCESDIWYKRYQGMLLDLLEDIQGQTGFDFNEETGVRNVVTCSDDVFDARTISNNGMTDVVGSHYRGEEKVAQDGLNALMYAATMILSGHDDVVYVAGHCKESQSECRNMVTNLAYDPFYCRPLGLDYLNTAGLQAMAYMMKSGLTQEQMADIVVRSRRLGSKNPFANAMDEIDTGTVMASPMICRPLRKLHVYPVSDGAVAFLLASEERAKDFTDNPVWITGFGNCMDSYFMGDRDLTENFALKKAKERACRRAGIKDLKEAVDLVEVMDCCAYQQPLWLEGLGLCGEHQGPAFLRDGGAEEYNVNMSGGMLAGNPLMTGGMYRAAEAVLQLKGEAGYRQVDGAACAAVHSTTGGAGQFQSVMILES